MAEANCARVCVCASETAKCGENVNLLQFKSNRILWQREITKCALSQNSIERFPLGTRTAFESNHRDHFAYGQCNRSTDRQKSHVGQQEVEK